MQRRRDITSRGYSQGNSLRLIRGGAEYFDAVHDLIEQAQECIHCQYYIFEEDQTGKSVKDKLIEASKRGIKIFMVLDGYASRSISDSWIKELKDAGIRFRWFEPFLKARYSYLGRRLHHKLLVADARCALVGGVNIGNRYNDFPGQPAWLDWAINAEGEVCLSLARVATDIWHQARWSFKREKYLRIPFQSFTISQHCLARVRQNDWVRNRKQVTRSYLEMFRNATDHIYILSSYLLPANIFRKRIINARKRGVNVKLVVAGVSDVITSKHAERYVYRWLLKNDIEIYEYSRGILHGKVASYDGEWATIGSYNFNYLSTYASIELNIEVLDKEFVLLTESSIQKVIDKDCVLISPENYRTRYGFLTRCFQWACYASLRFVFFILTFYYRPGGKHD